MSAQEASKPVLTHDPHPVINLLTEVEERLGQLKNWQNEHEEELATFQRDSLMLALHREQVDRRQIHLTQRRDRLDRLRRALRLRRDAVARDRHDLENQGQDIQRQRDELALAQSRLDELQARFAQAQDQLRQDQNALATRRSELEQQSQELHRQRTGLDADRQTLKEQRTTLDELRRQAEQQQAANELEQHRLGDQQQSIDDAWSALEGQKLAIAEREIQLESQRTELAGARAEARTVQAVEKERQALAVEKARVREEQQDLAQQRQELDVCRRELDAQAAAATQQVSALKQQQTGLDTQAKELEALQAQLDRDKQATGAAQAAVTEERTALAQREAWLETRRGELEQERRRLAEQKLALTAKAQELDQRQQQLTQQADTAAAQAQDKAAAQAQAAASDELLAELAKREEALARREAGLEKKQAEYQTTVKRAAEQMAAEREFLRQKEAAGDQRHKQMEERLKSINPRLIERMKLADDALRKRRGKLARYRKVLRERGSMLRQSEARVDSYMHQYEGLLQQRQMLLDVKQFLANSEAEMVRRWATQRAAGIVVGGLFCLLFLAIASYLAGQQIAQPVWQASTVIAGAAPQATAQAPADGDVWLASRRSVLLSDPVLKEAMNQLDQRGLRPYDDIAQFRLAMDQSLQLSALDQAQLRLDLQGKDREQIVTLLESLGRGYVGHELMQAHNQNRPGDTRIVRAAARLPDPVRDDRLKLGASIFGVGLLLSIILAVVFRWWLLRASRVLESESAAIFAGVADDAKWPTPGSAGSPGSTANPRN
ncbi:MAG: hypothetical protein WD042_01750 [Phycisphaeraceae bacterium]